MTHRPSSHADPTALTRLGLALALAFLTTLTACDKKPKPSGDADAAALAELGLRTEKKTLVEYQDGTRAFLGSTTDRTQRGRQAIVSEKTQLAVALPMFEVEPWSATVDEIVVFDGEAEGLALRAKHGITPPEPVAPIGGLVWGDEDWLEPPNSGIDDFTRVDDGRTTDPIDTAIGGLTIDPGRDDFGFTGNPGGGGKGGDFGEFDFGGRGPALPTRYVMADDLTLRALPTFGSGAVLDLQQGDRVFVLDTPPNPAAGGHVFVEVQVADRYPYPTGWFPLHWLTQVAPQDTADTLTPEATYGLFGRLARDFVQETFWKGCSSYPTFPHDANFHEVPSVVDASIPWNKRYECGELPIGTIENSTWKHITTYDFESPSFHAEVAGIPVVHIDSIPFSIPIKLHRLPWQTRGEDYSVLDLSTGRYFQFDDSGADVEDHSRYARIPGVLEEDVVRVHDTDVWYNLTFEPPPGVEDIGAEAYLNVCMYLPGFRLRGGHSPMNIKISSLAKTTTVDGISWGAYDVSPFRVCATSAVSTKPGDPMGDLTTGPQAPMRLRLLRASLHDLSIRMVEGIDLYGTFKGVHGPIILMLTDFANALLMKTGVLGLLFEAFLQEGFEAKLMAWLNEMASTLAQGLPDPDAELADACDLMPDAYASPTHRYYPIYKHCTSAVEAASIELATNQDEAASSCHSEWNAYGRANDVTSFTSPTDDDDYFFADLGGPSPEVLVVDRPWWNSCGLESEVDTVVPDDYWPVLECASTVMEDALNYQMSNGAAQGRLQSECLLPTVKMLCDWYGEGDDLIELWTGGAGGEVPVGNTFGFCDWYASLSAPDTPDFTMGD